MHCAVSVADPEPANGPPEAGDLVFHATVSAPKVVQEGHLTHAPLNEFFRVIRDELGIVAENFDLALQVYGVISGSGFGLRVLSIVVKWMRKLDHSAVGIWGKGQDLHEEVLVLIAAEGLIESAHAEGVFASHHLTYLKQAFIQELSEIELGAVKTIDSAEHQCLSAGNIGFWMLSEEIQTRFGEGRVDVVVTV